MKRPVVLVHGIFDSARPFKKMARFLSENGFDPLVPNLTPSTGRKGIDELALQLRDFIEENVPHPQRFDLVGHSMGGLVCRYYLQRMNGMERVRRFISLSSPHRGSLLAYLLWNAACGQMRPGSTFLKELNQNAADLERVGFVSLWTPWDLSVVPARSSCLGIGVEQKVPVLLHPMMRTNRRALDAIVRYLNEFEPEPGAAP